MNPYSVIYLSVTREYEGLNLINGEGPCQIRKEKFGGELTGCLVLCLDLGMVGVVTCNITSGHSI